MTLSTVAKKLTGAENSRTFLDGSIRSSVKLRSAIIGSGVYQAGWKWSLHAGSQTGRASENHIGYIISGHMTVQDAAGTEWNVGPGDAFEVGPGHDAWVVGNEPCVAIDFYHCV
jgi:uncharacterized cupin superfamily protein